MLRVSGITGPEIELVPFSEEFARDVYTVVRSVLAGSERHFHWNYVSSRFGGIVCPEGDIQVPGTPAAYGDFVTKGLLKRLQPVVEGHVGLARYPSYSYLRFYKNGDRLKKHTDRPACEISTTLCLGYRPEQPWAIWLERLGKALPVTLLAGARQNPMERSQTQRLVIAPQRCVFLGKGKPRSDNRVADARKNPVVPAKISIAKNVGEAIRRTDRIEFHQPGPRDSNWARRTSPLSFPRSDYREVDDRGRLPRRHTVTDIEE